VVALAQQLAQQGAVLQELQARLAKSSHNSSKPLIGCKFRYRRTPAD
jgi:hypothetical protein